MYTKSPSYRHWQSLHHYRYHCHVYTQSKMLSSIIATIYMYILYLFICITTLFAISMHVYVVNNRAQGPEWPIAIWINLSYLILSYLILSYLILSYFILSYLILLTHLGWIAWKATYVNEFIAWIHIYHCTQHIRHICRVSAYVC